MTNVHAMIFKKVNLSLVERGEWIVNQLLQVESFNKYVWRELCVKIILINLALNQSDHNMSNCL